MAAKRIKHPIGDTFAGNLRRTREDAGLSQQALASLAGTSAPQISKIENNAQDPGISLCARLADALGVPLSDLLFAAPPSKPKSKKRGRKS